VADFPNDVIGYLKASCDQVSDLTERMVRLANQLGWVGPITSLQRAH
jgi:hypothetical protein